MRTWQVEYMKRPDETEHIVPFGDLREAVTFARQMSDEHSGSSVLVALDDYKDKPGCCSVGHVEFCFGVAGEREGVFRNIALPGEQP